MKITKIECKNFKAYKSMKLDFDSLNGISLIVGNNHDRMTGESSNGSAKSTILDAIMYAFFGKTATGISGDAIINRYEKKNTHVKLSFINNGIKYKIERYRKNSKFKNKVIFYKENQDITQPTNKSTDNLILDTIGIKYETMLSTLFFNSSSINSFINATDKNRKALIENLIDISIYKEAQSQVKDDVNAEKQHLQDLEHKKDMLEKEQESNKKLLDFYAQKQDERKARIDRLNTLKLELKNKLNNISLNDTDLDSLEKDYNQLTNELNNLQLADITPVQTKLNDINNTRNQVIKQGKQAKSDVIQFKNEYDELYKSEQPTCKYCGNFLDTEHRKKELERLASMLNESVAEYKKLQTQFSNIPDSKPLETKLNELKSFNNSINAKRETLQQKLSQIQNSIATIRQKQYEYQNTKDRLVQLDEELKELENETNTPPIIDNTVDSKISNISEKIDKVNDNIMLLNDLIAIFSDKGVKSQVMANVLPTINQYLKEYLNILSNNSLYAQLSTKTETKTGKKSEKINIKIYSETTGENFDDLSSGEKKRVAIAINLAFMQFLLKNYDFNILFLDEIFDSLDGNGIDNVEHLLQHLKSTNPNLKMFVISHDTNLKTDDIFDNLITVTKVDGCSSVNTRQLS